MRIRRKGSGALVLKDQLGISVVFMFLLLSEPNHAMAISSKSAIAGARLYEPLLKELCFGLEMAALSGKSLTGLQWQLESPITDVAPCRCTKQVCYGWSCLLRTDWQTNMEESTCAPDPAIPAMEPSQT